MSDLVRGDCDRCGHRSMLLPSVDDRTTYLCSTCEVLTMKANGHKGETQHGCPVCEAQREPKQWVDGMFVESMESARRRVNRFCGFPEDTKPLPSVGP